MVNMNFNFFLNASKQKALVCLRVELLDCECNQA